MRKTLAVPATVAAVGATAMTVPAPAEARGLGPGLAFGLAAGALTAGAMSPLGGRDRGVASLWLWAVLRLFLRTARLLRPGPVRL